MPGGAAISDITKKAIVKILDRLHPEIIVDLGTGEGESLSTFLKYSGAQQVYTVDNGLEYIHAAHKHGEIKKHPDRIHWIHAPCVPIEGFGHDWYDVACLRPIPSGINLLMVDGPMGVANRGPAIPVLLRRMSIDGEILLDDTACNSGRGVVAGWLQFLCEEGVNYNYDYISTDRGLAHIMLKGRQHGR